MLHCEVLQYCHAHSIGCGHGWCGIAGIGLCACVCVLRLEKWQKI